MPNSWKNVLGSLYLLRTRFSLKRVRCYLADDVDFLLARLHRRIGWHPYKDAGDAPKVAEYQKEAYLCMVQRYAKDTGEEVGTVDYKVLLCDDNGLFWGLDRRALVDSRVIAWKEITGRDYEKDALAYQRQGTMK